MQTTKAMRAFAVRKAKTTYPTGNKNFAVLQAFPSGFSETESDPFLMCDEFGPTPSKGIKKNPDEFPVNWHPHRGQDLLTYIRQGFGRHADSMGNRETFPSPGLQWISAGSGIEHAEGGGTPEGELEHGFQIWVNVPASKKMEDPRYGTEPTENIPHIKGEFGEARVLAGEVGEHLGPFKTVQQVQIVDFTIFPGQSHVHQIPESADNCLIYVFNGEAEINGHKVPTGHVIRLDATTPDAREVHFTASQEGMSAMVFAGKRLNEPIAWRGPMVMNTDEQIYQAYAEYQKGTFLKKRAAWDFKRISDFPQK